MFTIYPSNQPELNEATIEVNSAVEAISVESKEKSLEIQDIRQSNANTLDSIMDEMDVEETITPVIKRRSVVTVDNPSTQEKTIIIREVGVIKEVKEIPSEKTNESSTTKSTNASTATVSATQTNDVKVVENSSRETIIVKEEKILIEEQPKVSKAKVKAIISASELLDKQIEELPDLPLKENENAN